MVNKPRQEGKRICMEMIQEIREISGISGVYVMAYRQEEIVAEIIDASGVLAGRRPWHPNFGLGTSSNTRAVV